MTVRYVGIGGSDANSGLTWALRKLTLNGVEDTPIVAGDTVYVGPGTYRETLTLDVSATVGNPITYIGDYLGTNTDGVGGVVRITGSDNDQTATRTSCINAAAARNYRTFQGFVFDTTTSTEVNNVSGANWIIDKCYFNPAAGPCISIAGALSTANTIQGCFFYNTMQHSILFSHSVVVDNAAHVVQNNLFLGGVGGVRSDRVGGITVKNNAFLGRHDYCVRVVTAITVGQTITVNNCIFQEQAVALQATVLGEVVEDYNTFFLNSTNRTNTATGANSLTYPALLDSRWFFQLTHAGAGPNHATQLISPFDLASFSALLNVAGTSPSTTDLRGTAVQGAEREWGALEYDSTIKIAGSAAGGGNVNLLVGKL